MSLFDDFINKYTRYYASYKCGLEYNLLIPNLPLSKARANRLEFTLECPMLLLLLLLSSFSNVNFKI